MKTACIEEVKQKADIVRIVGDYLPLKRSGQNYFGPCPFHQEKTPSFAVHPVKQIYHCFGCGVSGDVFQFVMAADKLTFPEAVRLVAEKVGVAVPEHQPRTPEEAKAERLRADLFKIHEVAAQLFSKQLQSSDGALALSYLGSRGLSEGVLREFNVGYSLAGGDCLFRELRKAGFGDESLVISGLVNRDKSGGLYDRFRGRIMFPIADERGRVVAFGGRIITKETPKYLNSPETPIYSKSRVLYNLHRAKEHVRKVDYALVVEGYPDTIAVYTAGLQNVVAACGSTLTESQARLLSRYAHNAVLSFDSDAAGIAATERSLATLLEKDFQVRIVELDPGLDPDSFIRKCGKDAYSDKIRSSLVSVDYLAGRARAVYKTDTAAGKSGAANFVLSYVAKIPDRIRRAAMLEPIAEQLGIEGSLLAQELERALIEGKSRVKPTKVPAVPRISEAERRLINLFVNKPETRQPVVGYLSEHRTHVGLAGEKILEVLLASGNLIEASKSLSESDRRLLFQIAMEPESPGGQQEAGLCIAAMRLKLIERRVAELGKLIAKSRGSEVSQLIQEKAQLLQEREALRKVEDA